MPSRPSRLTCVFTGANADTENENENSCSPNAESSKSTYMPAWRDKCRIQNTTIKTHVTKSQVVEVDFHDCTTAQMPNTENENGTCWHQMPNRPNRLLSLYMTAHIPNTEYHKIDVTKCQSHLVTVWRRKYRRPKQKRKLFTPKAESSKLTSMILRLHKYWIPNTENENGNWCPPMPSRQSRLARFYFSANAEYRKWKRKLMLPNAESSKSTYMVRRPHKCRIENTVIKLLSPNAESSKSTFMTLWQGKYRISKTKMELVATQCRVVQVDLHGSTTTQIPNTENGNGNWSHPMLSRPSRPTWFYDLTNTE